MKYIEEYLKDVIKIKPLGELTTEDDELNGISERGISSMQIRSNDGHR